MKIAFIVGTFPALSVSFIINQIKGLIDHGHEVDIYALDGPPKDTSKVHTIRLLAEVGEQGTGNG